VSTFFLTRNEIAVESDTTHVISSVNSMFDHLLELSRWDHSNKWKKHRIYWRNRQYRNENIHLIRIENIHLIWNPASVKFWLYVHWGDNKYYAVWVLHV